MSSANVNTVTAGRMYNVSALAHHTHPAELTQLTTELQVSLSKTTTNTIRYYTADQMNTRYVCLLHSVNYLIHRPTDKLGYTRWQKHTDDLLLKLAITDF